MLTWLRNTPTHGIYMLYINLAITSKYIGKISLILFKIISDYFKNKPRLNIAFHEDHSRQKDKIDIPLMNKTIG